MVPSGLEEGRANTKYSTRPSWDTCPVWPGLPRDLGPQCSFGTVLSPLAQPLPTPKPHGGGRWGCLCHLPCPRPPSEIGRLSCGFSLCQGSASPCFQASEAACPASSEDAADAVRTRRGSHRSAPRPQAASGGQSCLAHVCGTDAPGRGPPGTKGNWWGTAQPPCPWRGMPL